MSSEASPRTVSPPDRSRAGHVAHLRSEKVTHAQRVPYLERPGWPRRLRAHIWPLALLAVLASLAYPFARDLVLGVEVTAAQRGHQVAVNAGCFNCHGPDGSGGVKNPGSKDGEVPGFAGGTIMMWVKSDAELREYLLDGAPARKRADPHYRREMRSQLLAMPAYRGYLGEREVDDVLAYLRVVSGLIVPSDELATKGQDLAYKLGCFRCHGPMGAGGGANPGSFKGYIPGWWGDDYRELVRSDDELREWIREGQIARLRDHWIARYFLRWQRVSMPAYGDFVSDPELAALMRYVQWVHAGEWRGKPLDLGH
jgi:mono/diheme cytochrome c family protein